MSVILALVNIIHGTLVTFVSLNKIGFIYSFGSSNETTSDSMNNLSNNAPTFTDEFQKVFQQANRIYDKYYRDASLLAEQNRYDEAIALLKKSIPLKPKENGASIQLLNTCEQTILANKMNEFITEARQYEKKDDYISAYKTYLESYNLNPEDKNVKIFLSNILDKVSSPVLKKEIDKIKKDYVSAVAKTIDMSLEQNDYFNIEKEYKKIINISPESDEANSYKRKIADKKSLYIYKFISSGLEYLKNDNPSEAYQCFIEAHKLNPNDTSIIDQTEIAKKKYLTKRNFSIEDNLYSDKLYYLAAINYATERSPLGTTEESPVSATDETSLATYNELKTFNPVYEYLPDFEDSLISAQMIKRRKP